jgi:hypothetical protein
VYDVGKQPMSISLIGALESDAGADSALYSTFDLCVCVCVCVCVFYSLQYSGILQIDQISSSGILSTILFI